MAADLGLALVLVLVSLVLFKPSIAASLDVPFKLIVPLAAVLLVIRAVSKETP
ncbi:MAG: hypothetical protein ACKV2T_25195 [Kofleriaceae bacterium]